MALNEALKELLGPDLSKAVADRVNTVAQPAVEAACKQVIEEKLKELLQKGATIKGITGTDKPAPATIDEMIVEALKKQCEIQASQAVTKAMAWRRELTLDIRLTESGASANGAA